jgi:S-adenosylmethionine synthetase
VGHAPLSPLERLVLEAERRIGSPVTRPAVLHVRITTKDGSPVDAHKSKVEEVAATCLARLPKLVDDFVAGRIRVF